MAINAAQSAVKTVADPNASYESLKPLWNRSRAVCSGERFVKDYDSAVDVNNFNNLLIPFSPSMTTQQYNFYKAEAELPGIVSQFSRMLVGGLLRKQPVLKLPEAAPADALNWILNEFGRDSSPLSAFLDTALWEEIQTSRAWVFVDYPTVQNADFLTKEEIAKFKPYPVLQAAENIINWRVRHDQYGRTILDRVVVRGYSEDYTKNEFHPEYIDTVWVHELNEAGYYQIRKFQKLAQTTNVPVVSGQTVHSPNNNKGTFVLVDTITDIKSNDEYLREIPAWPLNGNIDAGDPILAALIDKEVVLYNKMSRRNHLLYGAATYTPVIASDMTDDQFQEIVESGLGTWIKLSQGDTATVLETPTGALQDMDRAIAAALEEMAKMGIRMLSPETAQSGIALEIRNAAQTAQLGTLNTKVSNTMKQVIAFMLNWRYGTEFKSSEIEFSLSADFNPIPLGADWLRLATEWYQQGLIPRSIWLQILKQNDILSPDYDDEKGREEITEDMDLAIKNNPQDSDFVKRMTND